MVIQQMVERNTYGRAFQFAILFRKMERTGFFISSRSASWPFGKVDNLL